MSIEVRCSLEVRQPSERHRYFLDAVSWMDEVQKRADCGHLLVAVDAHPNFLGYHDVDEGLILRIAVAYVRETLWDLPYRQRETVLAIPGRRASLNL